jgi:hypothetical protein
VNETQKAWELLEAHILHDATLKAMLERGEAWKCKQCGEINGRHNPECWKCFEPVPK